MPRLLRTEWPRFLFDRADRISREFSSRGEKDFSMENIVEMYEDGTLWRYPLAWGMIDSAYPAHLKKDLDIPGVHQLDMGAEVERPPPE